MTIYDAKALIGLCIDEGLKQGVLKNRGELEELLDYLDKYFIGKREQHKSVPGKYAEMDFESARNTFSEDVYNHNRKNKTPIDMIDLDDAFETGADWVEKQMLKEAVEWTITCHNLNRYILVSGLDESLTYGDKVKLIIVKEDKK